MFEKAVQGQLEATSRFGVFAGFTFEGFPERTRIDRQLFLQMYQSECKRWASSSTPHRRDTAVLYICFAR